VIKFAIRDILVLDDSSKDITKELALESVQGYNNKIINIDEIEYKYKSIQTLLGDTSPDWYKKIKLYEWGEKTDNEVIKTTSFPVITISSPRNLTYNDKNKTAECDMSIGVRINPVLQNSFLCHNIIYRIRQILSTFKRGFYSEISYTINMYGIGCINSIIVNGLSNISDDACTLGMSCKFTEY